VAVGGQGQRWAFLQEFVCQALKGCHPTWQVVPDPYHAAGNRYHHAVPC
jgi:hypothetical protein